MVSTANLFPSGGAVVPGFPSYQDYPPGFYILPAMNFAGVTNANATADLLYLAPFIIKRACTITHVVFKNATSVDTLHFRGGLFASADRVADALLSESADTTVSDSNLNTHRELALAVAQDVEPGLFYGGILCQSASNLLHWTGGSPGGFGADYPVSILSPTAAAFIMSGCFTKSHSFGALPVTAGAVSGGASSFPAIGLKVQ